MAVARQHGRVREGLATGIEGSNPWKGRTRDRREVSAVQRRKCSNARRSREGDRRIEPLEGDRSAKERSVGPHAARGRGRGLGVQGT